MVSDDMYLGPAHVLDCLVAAERILSAIEDAPTFADNRGALPGRRVWTVCGADVRLDMRGKAGRIEDVRAEGNADHISLLGIAGLVPRDDEGNVLDHPQKQVFAGDARIRRKSFVALAGLLAHEASHVLQHLSPSRDVAVWNDAKESSAKALPSFREHYEAYVSNVYERMAHATQAVAELLVEDGRAGFHDRRLLERRFRNLRFVRRIVSWPGEPGPEAAAGNAVDAVWGEVVKVAHLAGLTG